MEIPGKSTRLELIAKLGEPCDNPNRRWRAPAISRYIAMPLSVLCLLCTFGISRADAQAFAYVANYNSNNVSVINTATNAVVATVPVGITPEGIAITPDSTRVYVTNIHSADVSVIDTATSTVELRAKVLTVVPLCPFTADYIRRHEEYLDLVHPDYRARVTTRA